MKQVVIAMLSVVLLGCCGQRTARAADEPAALPAPTTRPTTAPVAAVWYDVGYPPPRRPGEERPEWRRLIVCVWADGTVVWSDDRARGGRPYHIGRIPGELRDQLVASLKAVGLLDIPGEVRFGPDASYTVIAAELDGKRQWLGSWHDPPTTQPRLHVGQGGMSVLPPGEPRPKYTPDYARFRDVWSESRRLIESVVPERHGRPLNEELDAATFDVGRERRK